MEKLLYNVSQILGTTIIHSLWQGLLIYTALQLVFLAVLGLSAQKKHNLGMLALFAMLGWFGYTFYTEFNAYNWNPEVSNYRLSDNISLSLYNTYIPVTPAQHASLAAYKAEFFSAIKNYLPYIAFLYAIGLVINLGRLGLAWNRIRMIKKDLIGNLSLQNQVNVLSRKLGVRKPVQLSFTTRIDGPCVINFVKPILLLPVTITTQLSAEEVEAILIHELSHIQSNDYLLNLLQQLITVLLFFNPFAILINRSISSERENRCDDIVVQTTGDPLIYAQALLKLEETRQTTLTLALAATGKKFHLLTRIERIMKSKKPVGNFKHLILAMVILAGSLASISWLNPEIKNGKIVLKRTAAKILPATVETPLLVSNVAKVSGPVKHKNHFTIVAADTTPISQLIDTPKKVKKSTFKIVLEDADGNKKEYSSLNDLPADARKEFLKENVNRDFAYSFNSDSARFGDFAKNYNFDFKYLADMPKMNLEKLKDLKTFNADKMKLYMDNGKNKKALKDLGKNLKKLSEDQRKFYSSPAFKDNMKKFTDEQRKFYSSPAWKDSIKRFTDEQRKYFTSPEWKKQQEDIAKQATKFSQDFVNSPEWKKQQEELTKLSTTLSQEIVNSPEFKKRRELVIDRSISSAKRTDSIRVLTKRIQEAVKREINEARLRVDSNNRVIRLKMNKTERPERPEKPEQPEKKEKTERPEKKEKAERPEKKEKAERPEKPELPETPKQ